MSCVRCVRMDALNLFNFVMASLGSVSPSEGEWTRQSLDGLQVEEVEGIYGLIDRKRYCIILDHLLLEGSPRPWEVYFFLPYCSDHLISLLSCLDDLVCTSNSFFVVVVNPNSFLLAKNMAFPSPHSLPSQGYKWPNCSKNTNIFSVLIFFDITIIEDRNYQNFFLKTILFLAETHKFSILQVFLFSTSLFLFLLWAPGGGCHIFTRVFVL